MKRLFSIISIITLLCTLFTGCQAKKDLPTASVFTESGEQLELPLVTVVWDGANVPLTNIMNLLRTVPGYNQEFTVDVTQLNMNNEPERSQALRRMSTEILAGKGPDLFVSDCWNGTMLDLSFLGIENGDGPMFNFPSQAMKNHLFLPLDDYIENAEFMEFDKLNPAIMAAGRNEEGQQILPMTFDFQVTKYIPSAFNLPYETPKSRQEMLDSGCPVLEYAANGGDGFQNTLLDAFSQTIDPDKDVPGFTEDALVERALDVWENGQKLAQGEWDFDYDTQGGQIIPISSVLRDHLTGPDGLMVPSYNDAGGISAYVTMFAAINRNANYPDYSFRILDKLLSVSTMNEQAIYGWSTGLPVYTGADGNTPVLGGGSLTPEEQEQYQELLGMINSVRFLSALDREVMFNLMPVLSAEGSTAEDVENATRKEYTTFKMMLAES